MPVGVPDERERLAVLTAGWLAHRDAKTAHGVIRYGRREVVAVVDDRHAGRLAHDVVPYVERPVPVVASVAEARARGAEALLVGVAPDGGKLDAAWRATLLEAIAAGLHVEAGLHGLLRDDPELVAMAERHGVALRDLRAAPGDLDVPPAAAVTPAARVVHSVGSDCAIGKMSVTLELDRAARRRGRRSVFVPTGQTGIAIAGWGIAVDHVVSDYVAGAADRLVREGAGRGDLLWVEGQGSLYHPAYSGVTLALLHGSRPDVLLLCHEPGPCHIGGYPAAALPPLGEIVRGYEAAAAWIHPAPVAAIALNTGALDEQQARSAIEAAAAETGLVADDVVRFGPDRILDAVLAALPDVSFDERNIACA